MVQRGPVVDIAAWEGHEAGKGRSNGDWCAATLHVVVHLFMRATKVVALSFHF